MMIVPNQSWKHIIGELPKHHPFFILNALNAIKQSINLEFKIPNLLLKVVLPTQYC